MDVEQLTQLKPQERAALAEYLERLRAHFRDRVLRVILYGSRARGEGEAESDLDVLIVVNGADYQFHREVALEAFEPSLKHSVLISPQVWDRARYERQRAWQLLFFRNLERDGIQLWTGQRKPRRSLKGSTGRKTISKR
ncbi:MAG TPA: nucleotidyltransferase domain-containing protein, partial [Anaerolineae bacterium]